MFDQIVLLAASIALPSETEQRLLEALCTGAAEEASRRLRPGVAAGDCGDTFLCAAAMLAASGLIACRGCGTVEQFSAGDVSLRTGGSGESCKAAASMRQCAAEMMRPYWADDSFAFAGVKG